MVKRKSKQENSPHNSNKRENIYHILTIIATVLASLDIILTWVPFNDIYSRIFPQKELTIFEASDELKKLPATLEKRREMYEKHGSIEEHLSPAVELEAKVSKFNTIRVDVKLVAFNECVELTGEQLAKRQADVVLKELIDDITAIHIALQNFIDTLSSQYKAGKTQECSDIASRFIEMIKSYNSENHSQDQKYNDKQ